ncbi:hypothetical protein [Streptomyces alanosinicus]|uniref:PknH-like extracellular domain-containing protein n=1 Tax=Streptomyces alanosinicus TaxID=68171 RepID=A0A918YMB1_9ACTN|nr:hypothetical protein [Streptomyces alanosinicus]GHE09074.1 hypothetical protein GCM10010339_60210 [Streptomyces alanosinicus]
MKLSRTLVVTALAVTIAGCGAADNRPVLPPAGKTAAITRVDQVVRPIDAYLPTAEQSRLVERAAYVSSIKCLKRFGISQAPGPDPATGETGRRDVRSQLYGYFAPDQAATKGYDAVAIPQSRAPMPDSVRRVYYGRDGAGAALTVFHGKDVPRGGCLKEGLDAVGGSLLLGADTSAMPGGGPKQPLNDPRVVDADHKWSACMKAHGFVYATPADAYMDPLWRASAMSTRSSVTHSRAEVATATTDMACKQSTNFMGITVAVQSGYDKQYITATTAALASFKRRLDKQIAVAEKIIADSKPK